jgi:hypothetical protein
MKPVKGSAPRFEVASPRGRGRPRSLEPMSSVGTRLPTATHDQLIQIANEQDKSVSELIRQVIIFNVINIFPMKGER